MRLGEFELHSLSDGFFGLDGGAMFGVVPKPVWERTNPADSRNRIRLAARPLLIVTDSERILVDTGIGDRWDDKARDIYHIEKIDTIESSLARVGFRPEDITKVVLTHLHFDHAGATTKLDDTGKPVPRFPNARHYVQQREWNAALTPNRRSRASYRPDDFLPVQEAGLLELIDGDWKLDLTARDTIRNAEHLGHVPSLELVLTGGHTPGHQIVLLKENSEFRNQKSEFKTAVFWGDLIPTSSHIATPYIMGYDLSPLETMEQKEKLVQQAIAGKWLSFFEHDPEFACGVIEEENGKPFLRPLAV
ncbi:MBL fold metallo-hydrolase [candidate division WOR-3 bacterium]|nr:MBL fold metallo-hydrolase [candidate division WOR-3 bacterium]